MDIFDVYFMAVCSIRFHPANHVSTDADIKRECAVALRIVEEMLICRSLRQQSLAGPLSPVE